VYTHTLGESASYFLETLGLDIDDPYHFEILREIITHQFRLLPCIDKTMSETAKADVTEVETASSSAASSSVPAVRFEIKKWNAVTMWSWDICADVCAICRNSLNEPSIEYQVTFDYPLDTFVRF
jgi:hypothetical protein